MGSRCSWFALGQTVWFFPAENLGCAISVRRTLGRVSFSLNVCSFFSQWGILDNISESCQTVQ